MLGGQEVAVGGLARQTRLRAGAVGDGEAMLRVADPVVESGAHVVAAVMELEDLLPKLMALGDRSLHAVRGGGARRDHAHQQAPGQCEGHQTVAADQLHRNPPYTLVGGPKPALKARIGAAPRGS